VTLETYEHIDEYQTALKALHDEFESRFEELNALRPELKVFMTQFSVRPEQAPSNLQVELIKLQCDSILSDRYYHYNDDLIAFYEEVSQQEFPRIHALALRLVALFGTTYVCEQLFSLMNMNTSKTRTSLSDASLEAILRIDLSRMDCP